MIFLPYGDGVEEAVEKKMLDKFWEGKTLLNWLNLDLVHSTMWMKDKPNELKEN